MSLIPIVKNISGHFTESKKSDSGYNVFRNYDLYAREMMETLQIPILEVKEAFTMRPDSHVVVNPNMHNGKIDHRVPVSFDCVRSCLPGGGMDVQIQMVAHYLYYLNQLSHSHHLH